MIKLFGYSNTRALRVAWMLEELETDYEVHLVDLAKGEGQSAEFRAINPAGKVPALQDGDLVMTESAAIVSYLGDKFAEKGLVPKPGTHERGRYEQWAHFAMSELEQPLWTQGKHKFALPKERRVPEIFDTAAWEYQCGLKLTSEGLGDKPYILGDRFTAADILIGHTLFWGDKFGHPLEQDNLQAYMKRVAARPALARARNRLAAE